MELRARYASVVKLRLLVMAEGGAHGNLIHGKFSFKHEFVHAYRP